MRYIEQRTWPLAAHGRPWLAERPPDLSGYEAPNRSPVTIPKRGPLCTVLGTVRDELPALRRSWTIWERQELSSDLAGRIEYVVLDEGSRDGVEEWCAAERRNGAPIVYVRTRRPGAKGERSCTLAMNACIRRAKSPLAMVQWWDRIPGSLLHLELLLRPHLQWGGILTSTVARHMGASSSVADVPPGFVESALGAVPRWRQDPTRLARIAGPIGGHCLPGRSSEFPGFVIPRAEFEALGGFDERYRTRASYVNVEFARRCHEAGLYALFPAEPHGANYHQTHSAAGGRSKDWGWLHDPLVRRNQGRQWGQDVECWEESR